MENQDHHREQARDGAGLNDSTTRPAGHSTVSYLVHGSGNGNASSGNTFGTCLPFYLSQNKTGGRSNNNVQFNSSVYAAAGNANSYSRRRPVDHTTKGAACSKSKVPVYCQSPPVNDELKLIENIADTLSPAEVRHLLFQGHEDEHKARPLLGSNVGHQNDNDLAGQFAQVIDLRASCIYCYRSVSNGNAIVSQRSCGHYFHKNCFHLHSEVMKGQHIWFNECRFCQLEKH